MNFAPSAHIGSEPVADLLPPTTLSPEPVVAPEGSASAAVWPWYIVALGLMLMVATTAFVYWNRVSELIEDDEETNMIIDYAMAAQTSPGDVETAFLTPTAPDNNSLAK